MEQNTPIHNFNEIRTHKYVKLSRANGPGLRFTIWFQGCTKKCEGCINPETHDLFGGKIVPIEELWDQILTVKDDIEGVTFTGGEPLLQPYSLEILAKKCQSENLGVIVLTGFTNSEIMDLKNYSKLIKSVDLMVAGPFHHDEIVKSDLRGSQNKELIFYSQRYTEKQILSLPKMEILVSNKEIIGTGTTINDFFDWDSF